MVISLCVSLDEAEDLRDQLKDAIASFYMEDENDVIRNMAKYLHENGVRASKTLGMAGELQGIVMKYSPRINIDDYIREKMAKYDKKK